MTTTWPHRTNLPNARDQARSRESGANVISCDNAWRVTFVRLTPARRFNKSTHTINGFNLTLNSSITSAKLLGPASLGGLYNHTARSAVWGNTELSLILNSYSSIITVYNTIISLLSLYTALHSHAQPSVVMTIWLTNVCAGPNSESACMAILGSISVWAWNRAIPGFWKAESETWSAKRHVTITCREDKSCDHHVSESERWLVKRHVIITCRKCNSRDYHVTVVHWKRTTCVGVQIRASRVPDRWIKCSASEK